MILPIGRPNQIGDDPSKNLGVSTSLPSLPLSPLSSLPLPLEVGPLNPARGPGGAL